MHCVEDELFRVYLEVRGSAASGVLLKLQARGKITSQARWLRIKQEAKLQHPPLGLQVHKSATGSAAPGPVNATAACGGATHTLCSPTAAWGMQAVPPPAPNAPRSQRSAFQMLAIPPFRPALAVRPVQAHRRESGYNRPLGPSAPGEPVISSNNNH